ncbi:MAG TPA: SusE domain-containing protein [Mucilaginibacter sp.]|nr:SusE domain-containing protein [Mucilaginibacter sp.]
MKKTLLIISVFALGLLSACKKDPLVTVSANVGAPVLLTPTEGTAITVTAADSNEVVNATWSKADYGVDAVVSYFVQASVAGNNFATHIQIGETNNLSLSLTYGAINNRLINQLHLPANESSDIEIRAGAAIYGKDSVYSKPVKLTFTTYKELAPEKLYVPGAYQGWNPGAALTIPSVTTFTYEGYIYMNVGDYFKFTSAPDWDHINYGDAGGGKLSTDGLAAGLKVDAPGVYKLNADIQNLTYSATLISTIGMIGTATPHGWDASTAMSYDVASNKWSVKLDLVAGALKFRANDAWDINYGPADTNALSGKLIFNDPGAITITDAGNYTVTVDMSQSSSKGYNYTIVKN